MSPALGEGIRFLGFDVDGVVVEGWQAIRAHGEAEVVAVLGAFV